MSQLRKGQTPISQHLNANGLLSIMTVVASFGLAFTLFAIFLGRQDTLIAIYLTAGFLIAIGCWNVQTAYRTFAFKRRFKKELPGLNKESQRSLAEPSNQTEVVSWSRVELRTTALPQHSTISAKNVAV